jgi:hypothetical protein
VQQAIHGPSWVVLCLFPLLEQTWVKISMQPQSGTATEDPKSSLGPHPVLLHHSITSAWVHIIMLQQCATGNSWSILGGAVPLIEQPWVKISMQPQSRKATRDPKSSLGPILFRSVTLYRIIDLVVILDTERQDSHTHAQYYLYRSTIQSIPISQSSQ